MSKGIWTKHQTAGGVAFYFNSSSNESVWVPPVGAFVHDVPCPLLTEEDYQLYLSNISTDISSSDAVYRSNNQTQTRIQPPQSQQSDNFMSSQLEEELARRREAAARKLKSSHPTTNSEQVSSYLRQKSELEAITACKSDDSAKWLVR